MEVHLLGTAGYHPNEQRQTACVMIPEAGLIFDAGTGFFRVRDAIQTRDLHIFMSHCHLDHCIGLTFFIDVIYQNDIENIYVYGRKEKLDAIQQHLFSEHLFPLLPDFHWTPITDQPIDIPLQGKVTPFPLQHPGGSLGFRVDWPDKSFAYVTDTTAKRDADYIDSIRSVDLLLHECHFADGYEEMAVTTGHSCLTPVAEVCRAAEVKQATIIHINPLAIENPPLDLASIKGVYPGLTIGEDKMILSF